MPRLATSLLLKARNLNTLLPLLLRSCRDLGSAQNELRWFRDHAVAATAKDPTNSHTQATWQSRLRRMCEERSRGKPLQYILGSQPFGTLDILCRLGVLIPRPETESIAMHIMSYLPTHNGDTEASGPSKLRVLDLCTGTGCIALLTHDALSSRYKSLQILGIDNNRHAVLLARSNLQHNVRQGKLPERACNDVNFVQGDIFSRHAVPPSRSTNGQWDILIANPPYISPTAFNTTTERSVRNFEPRDALVPPSSPSRAGAQGTREGNAGGDIIYPRLLKIAREVGAKVVLFEVADMDQAMRVVGMAGMDKRWDGVEIWRDWPSVQNKGAKAEESVVVNGKITRVMGEGNGRAVFAWTLQGRNMIGRALDLEDWYIPQKLCPCTVHS
ncbi:MAG: hypothetical protein OHK93_003685 [Ramalina farinacea]|uniref:peptide chain release factor N(5)-glutamine methyltransferase n=1 Tax=Ramalina farinacea TaxID=258253 RepID=A0AA43QTP5_9LECA|nr:hypothetical protein [Ramalina farinacea]